MALVAAVLAVGMGGLAVPLLVPAGPAYAAATCSSATVSVARVSSPVLYLDTSVTPNVNSAYEGFRLTNGSGSAYEDLWVTSGSFAGPQIHLATYSTGRTHLGTLTNGATGYAFFYLTASAATSSSESHTISVYTTRPDLASGPLCTTTVSLDATSDIAASANKVSSVTVAPSTPSLGGSLTITVVGDAGTIGSAGIFATTPASYAAWRADAFKLTGAQVTIGGNTYQNTLYLSGLATGGAYTAVFTFAATGTTASSTSVSPMSHISSGTQIKHTSIDSTYQALSPIVSPANNTTLSVSASPTTLSSSGGTVTYTVTIVNAGATAVSLDDITVTLASGETYSTGTATFNSTAASDPSTSGSTLTFVDKYPIPAGTSRTLTFQVAVPGTAGSYTTSVVGHVGTTQIDTSVSTSTDSPAGASVTVAAPPPTVSAVSPSSGTDHGGTSVTVSGTNFVGVTAVTFGTTPASSYTVNSATSITVTTPAASAGTVDVTVTTISGTSATSSADQYTFTAPPNHPPVFTGAATNTSQSVAYGAGLTAVAATDPDSDPLTYSVSSGTLPAGITLNSDGTFTGTTTAPGDTSVVIGVSDGFGGTATTTLAVHVATPAPTVTSISPTSGTTAGGTSVTITGTWLTDATSVSFGSTAASSFVVNSATSITATSPAGSAGTVDITVTTPAGTSSTGSADHYTYVVPNRAPTFTNAATNTSQSVAYGAGLTAVVATDADSDPLTYIISSGTLPAGITLNTDGTFTGSTTAPGDTSVVIGVSDGRGGTDTTTLAVHVATPAPTVTAVSPSTGTTAGATSVTITGTWFTGATAVSFGSTAASSFVVNSATSITATSPAGSAGTVDITVTTPAGTSTTGSADHYTYTAADQPPAYTGAASNTSQTVGVGTALTTLAATDPDSDPLTFALASGTLPAGVTVNTDGTFAGTTTTPGDTTAVITVSDGRGGTASTTLVVHVLPAPTVAVDGGTTAWTIDPTPTISGTTTAADGSTVTVTIDGQTLTSTVSSGAWTVTAAVLADGTYPLVVTVTDPIAGTGTAGQQLAIDTQPPPVVPVTTTGTGTQLQTVTIDIPTSGTVTLLVGGSPVTSVTLPGQGIYSLDPATGVISFAPVLGFTGPATPVTFRVTGGSATVTSYYTATVIAPAPPAAPPRATVGPATQSVSITLPPGGTITLLDAHGNPVTTLVVRHIGTYHVVTTESAPIELALLPTLHRAVAESAPPPASAIITFTPVPGFTGTAPPVTFRLTDAYGQQVTATYTPTVTPQSLTLPTTGPDITATVALGLWLIVAGLAMVVSRPRRWLW